MPIWRVIRRWPIERLVAYYGRELGGLHLPFNFALLRTPWRARTLATLINEYEWALPPGGWPNWVLGNHDSPRIASRVGERQVRCAAMLLLTLRGTPTLYYGDEIGMPQSTLGPDEIRDPFERRVPGLGVGRDGCRTPMQWSEEKYAGFSSVPPWLQVEPDYRDRNVASENEVATSLLQLYRRLIALRRKYRALRAGSYRAVIAAGELLLFVRECEDERLLVALNLGDEPTSVSFPGGGLSGHVLLSSFCDRDVEPADASIELRPDEGVIIKLHAGAVLPD